jgi:hypothetical protein
VETVGVETDVDTFGTVAVVTGVETVGTAVVTCVTVETAVVT